MEHRELGTSGVEVSTVGFGGWVVGTDWWGDRGPEEAGELVDAALEAGVTFFDTGDVYGHGRSEELLAELLDGRRDEVTLATKVGYDFYENPQAGHGELPKEMNREYLERAVEESLDRLGTDHVELLQLHNANVEEVDGEILNLLDDLRADGTVEAVGWALGPSIGWLAEGDRAIEENFDAVQVVWNVLEPAVGNHFAETIDRLGADTSLVARVPHSSGLLNEQVTPETELDAGDHRGHRPQAWYETGWEKIERLRFLERDGERTLGQASIQWLLAHDCVASVTPTFRTPADVAEWAAAPDTPPLSDDELQRVAELAATNFGVDRDDGMDPSELRTSVDGADLEDAGLLSAAGD